MAIAYLTGGIVQDSTIGTPSISEALDTGTSGGNRVLVVFVSSINDTITDSTASAATYNGVSMTRQTFNEDGGNQSPVAAIFTLVSPATGSNTCAVTMSGDTESWSLAWAVYENVDQTTPVDVVDNDYNSAATTLTGLTVTTTGTSELIVVGVGAKDGANSVLTKDTAVTQRQNSATGGAAGGDHVCFLGDYSAPTATSYSDHCDNASSEATVGVMIALNNDDASGSSFVPQSGIII